ncbi:MAG: stage 0 sporulation protein [Deltaproteobacteria bacterium]|jgi:cell fate regulator YaaT (PSP1 superfamily)|nr:stage 0 sporulation protein [Deltaproteobacteria bacterium]
MTKNEREKKPLNPTRVEPPPKGGHRITKPSNTQTSEFPCRRTVNVRLRYGGQIQTFDCSDLDVDMGVWVVVKNDDLTRLGLVTSKPIIWPAGQSKKRIYLPSNRVILRVATLDDLARQAENELEERENFDFCLSCVKRLGLVMKLVAVEKTFDNYKTIFYYTSDERVDFRQLVKDLVRRLRTRIEMRQIKVRQEAMMLGGNGMCGRPFCCASFLKCFCPVSVRMAKEQNMSINTMKISGACGRLMCCLTFENPELAIGYEDDEELIIDDPSLDDAAFQERIMGLKKQSDVLESDSHKEEKRESDGED